MKLRQNSIIVWKIDLTDSRLHNENGLQILSSEEIKKADSFHFQTDRRRYVAAHFALRVILSHYTKKAPQKLEFTTNNFGKPSLIDADLKFNLSHSAEIALVAVSENSEVGVDVESFDKKIEHLENISQMFSSDETNYLENCPQTSQNKEFFRVWTRKEAFVKAKGEGLSMPLKSFSVINRNDKLTQKFKVKSADSAQEFWLGWDFEPAKHYVAALVAKVSERTEPIPADFNSLFQKSL
jgi:4'-phosphopantetheinyl transferase